MKKERMRKMFIKNACLLLCTIGLANSVSIGVEAEDLVTADGYKYTVLNNGTVDNTLDDTIEITGYTGSEKELLIPSEIDGKKVTSIGDNAFAYRTGLTSITMPDGVTSIGESAFTECKRLTSIDLPDDLKSIGYRAFDKCTGLTSVDIPDGVTKIAEEAFSGCSNLETVLQPLKQVHLKDVAR